MMIDPRIARTKQTVLAAAERLMVDDDTTNITFTSLARESTVSRRTIYAYWPTIDAVIADVLSRKLAERFEDLGDLTTLDRLTKFLQSVRAGMVDPLESTALLKVVLDASSGEDGDRRLHAIVEGRLVLFRTHVGSISPENFAQVVGPLFTTALVLRMPISDDLMAKQIALGMKFLSGRQGA